MLKPYDGEELRRLNERKLQTRRFDAFASPVLIADDSEADIYFLLRAFELSNVRNPTFITRSGRDTLNFLKGIDAFKNRDRFPKPGIVLLDLYMPGVNGFDILKWKSHNPEYERTLFIALTNSNSVKDISKAYDTGANTFLNKPLQAEELNQLLRAYQDFWALSRNSVETTKEG